MSYAGLGKSDEAHDSGHHFTQSCHASKKPKHHVKVKLAHWHQIQRNFITL
jgi:hypothetical protein